MESNQQSITPGKKLAHVQVYEKLYKMLTDGTFPVGMRLPAEPKLAKMLGVSRMTLRQALDLLHDDGLLYKVQGAGNFVMDRNKTEGSSLDQMGHPVFKCITVPLEDIEYKILLEPANEYERELLNIETPVIVAVHTWYRYEGLLVAYTFGVMAVETISKYHLDLTNKEQVTDFVQNKIYVSAVRAQLRFYPTNAGVSIQEEFSKQKEDVAMIMEKLYDEELHPIICNKHYIAVGKAAFEITAR